MRTHQYILILFIAAALTALPAEDNAVAVDGSTIRTNRLSIVVGKSGLPSQISIQPTTNELPLPLRGKKAELTEAMLQSIGRGTQLRDEMKLITSSKGNESIAQPTAAATVKLDGKSARVSSVLAAGDTKIELATTWSDSGRMDATLTLGACEIDSLFLQLSLAGSVDTAIAGPATSNVLKVYSPAEFAVAPGDGIAWASSGEGVPEGGRNMPGFLKTAFIGDGDRGFSWAADSSDGFAVANDAPFMQLLRDKAGNLEWRVYLVNSPTKIAAGRKISFSIIVHPTHSPSDDFRLKAWTSDGSVGAIKTVSGPNGGDAVSREKHLAATYPIHLHRHLLSSHDGVASQIRTNASKLIRPGQRPGVDWMALGRALLHDAGLDARGIANLMEGATAVKALDKFGAFLSDGKTEFVPYWRTNTFVRYGETFSSGDAFALTDDDPMAHVHVSMWRRPHSHTAKAMFVIVNESDKAVREYFYINKPEYLFGPGGNQVRAKLIVESWDFKSIPEESDWRKAKLSKSVLSHAGDKESDISLLDMTDQGFVKRPSAKDGIEVYGPVYIPARSYRILYGAGR